MAEQQTTGTGNAEKTVKVFLNVAATYGGVDYAPGVNEMPEKVANKVVAKKLGRLLEGNAETPEQEEPFTPLSLDETLHRFQAGDNADIVFKSLRHHKVEIVAQTPVEPTGGNKNATGSTPLPEDFPGKNVFEKPHILNANGFKTIEEVQAHTPEDLEKIDGIGAKWAAAALAYNK